MNQTRQIIALYVALLGGAALLAACGSEVPARLEIVDGREVEIAEAGSGGGATVVFEAGLGDDWTPWDEVASRVSEHAQVFLYSRPGYGASAPATTPRDPKTIVEELRSLLARQGYAPPYVLVGHSIGGGYVELFAKSHPDEVLALVLVDPRHRDFLDTCEAAKLDMCGLTEAQLATMGASTVAEYRAYATAPEAIGGAGPFGDYPVRVLTSAQHGWSNANDELWVSMLGALADEAADGEQIVVDGAGHYIQLDDPGAVVDAIVATLPEALP